MIVDTLSALIKVESGVIIIALGVSLLVCTIYLNLVLNEVKREIRRSHRSLRRLIEKGQNPCSHVSSTSTTTTPRD